jgi:hypothetical protein
MPGLRPQVMDIGEGTGAIGASASGFCTVLGTQWPLLPNQRMKVWNVGVEYEQDAGTISLKVNTISIQLVLLDQAGQPINSPSGNFLAAFILAGANYTDPTPGTQPFSLSKSGRPILEIQSGFLIAGVTGIPMPSFAQVRAFGSFTNTDAVNPQQVDGFLSALLTWE